MGSLHKDLTLDNIHAAVARVYDDIAERDADSAFNTVVANVDKMVRVDSPLAYYILTAITPVWSEFTNVGGDEWTELSDTPGSISAGLNVQGNAGGTALEFGQDLRAAANPSFNKLTVSGQISNVSVDLTAVDGALRLNRMTTAQRDALTPLFGMQIFNTSTSEPQSFDGAAWVTMMAAGDVLKFGSPVIGQVASWAGPTSIESNSGLAFTGSEAIFSKHVIRPFEAGIVASTTQAQGEQPLTEDINTVSTVANVNDVVTMPAVRAGRMIVVINSDTRRLQIFPAVGDNFLGSAANASISIVAGNMRIFATTDAAEWGYITAV